MLNLARGVLDAGHELDILSMGGPPGAGHPTHPLVERYRLSRRHVAIARPTSRIARLRGAPSAWRKAFATHGHHAFRTLPGVSFARAAWALRLLHEAARLPRADYDVIHCQFCTVADRILDHLERGTLRGKLVVHVRGHDMTSELARRGAVGYQRVFAAADSLIASSGRLRDLAIAAGCPAEKIQVVTSGIDLADFSFRRPSPPGDPVRLVAVGRLVEKKGFADIVEALAILRHRGHAVVLDVVGDGPLHGELVRQTHRLGLDGHVTFHGMRAAPDVARIASRGDLFVAASTTAADGDEDGIPNVVKEAMALGLPIVATRQAGIVELIEHGVHGMLVPLNDPDALAREVEQLLVRPFIWESLATAAFDRVKSTCANETVNPRILSIYRRALAGS